MGVGCRELATLWALALALARAQHPGEAPPRPSEPGEEQSPFPPTPWAPGDDPLLGVTILPPLKTAAVVRALNPAHNGRVCSTWGDFHYKTFDGDVFRFPGRCNYVFSAHCGAAYEDFNVQLRRGGTPNTSTLSKVSMKLNGMALELTKGSVLVNGRPTQLPFSQSGVLVEHSVGSLKVSARLGLVFMWNQDDSLLLELDPKYANQTCGLCGDFNGVPVFNEFISHGIRLSPVEFGSLQKMDGPTEQCPDPAPVPATDCSTGLGLCEELLLSEQFQGCRRLVNVSSYLQACQHDLCLCGEAADRAGCACHTLAEYSRQCAHAGGLPLDWRGPGLCPQTCPLNLQYRECGSPCADTCSNLEHSQACEDHCVAGCFCPEGTVLDDLGQTGCVPASQCPCAHSGATYAPGAVYSTECSTCTCSGGRWSCQEVPCPGTCSVLGGAHFSTFDEKPYTVHGDCSYVLAKPCNGSAFTVLAELRRCGLTDSESCLRSLTLSLGGGQTVITVQAGGEVFVDQVYAQLPVSAANITVFRPSTFFIIAQTNLGLQVAVQLVPTMQVFLTLAPELRGLTCGLCGNFNQNQADDFRTLGGVVEGTAAAFANTWKTQAACPNVRNSFEDPCTLSVENEKYAQHWCSRLTDPQGPFARCHAAVSPGSYYSRCLFDTCNCERSEDCLCAALSSYVHACAARGVLLSGWRAGACTKPMENCPRSMTYQDHVSTCQPTCRALSNEDPTCNISFVPVDGCTCPQGTFLDDTGTCVPATSCPCYHGASVIPSGESVHQQGAVCTCTKGTLTCIGGHTPDPVCAPPMVYADCRNASAGATGAGCQKSCHTLDMDCYSPQCVPGCVCPDGLVADGEGGCVAAADCPCMHNEASYRAGQTVRVGCNTCTCQSRMWQCTDEPCLATCAVYGDGHYLTFDGQRYGFSGNCEYTLVQDHCGGNDSSQDAFRVVTENVPCGTTGTTCSKAIKIFLGSHELKLSDGKVEVIQKAVGQEAPYAIRQVGIYLVVDTEAGLVLLWDKKTSIFLRLSPEFKGRVCGLCGNFDDNALNDFTTRSQSVVGDALEFGNSWKSSPSCPDAPAPRDPCTANPYRKSWAQKQCSLLNGATFQACHAHVDPTKYYEACVSDACACDSGGDCQCFCTAVAAYAQACREAGVCVSWRTPDVCPLFCDYYNPEGQCEWHYQPCGAPCLRTCRNPRGQCRHDTQGLEGCYPRCPAEAPIFDEDHMQCVAACPSPPPPPPCQVQGRSYRPGAAVPSDKNCYSCVCTESGVQCAYDADACVCAYGGQHFRPGDVIYHTTDGTGGCISALCGANGTVERRVYACGPSSPAPPTTFSFSTPPIATSSRGRPGTLPSPATSPAPTGTLSRAPPTAAGTSPRPQPSTASVSPHPGCGEDCQWSPWLDISRPGRGIDSGDFDTLDNLRAHGYPICQAPRAVECRAEDAPGTPLQGLGPRVECTPTVGLTCYNRDQVSGLCDNYQIRVRCCTPRACPTSRGPAPTTPRTARSTTPRATSAQTGGRAHRPTAGPSTSPTTRRTPAPGTPTPEKTTPPTPSAVPLSTPGRTTTPGSSAAPGPSEGPCKQELCSWTGWMDGSYPESDIDGGDFDTFQNLRSKGNRFCERPRQVECRAVSFPNTPLAELGQNVVCNSSVGLVCWNRDQLPPICYNYEIRVQCCEWADVCRGRTASVTPTATRRTPRAARTQSQAAPTPGTRVTSTAHRSASSEHGSPAATVSASPHIISPGTTSCQPRCRWTKWFDVDFPTPGPHGGDLETYGNIVSSGETICRRPEDIAQLQCRAESHPEVSVERVGQVVQCSPEVGLVCRNRDQRGTFRMCLNYEVRVLCCEPREGCPTYQPVTVPSTPSVTVTSAAETAAHGVRTRETSVPETSTPPVPKTSTISVPQTSRTSVPETSSTSVPKPSTIPVPQTSVTPVPETSSTPVPKPGTTPVPQTSRISVPKPGTTPVPKTSTTSVPKPSTTPVPETSSIPVPETSTTPVPKPGTTPVPETGTTPVPKPGTTPVPETSTTSVPAPATSRSTPGTTSCQPRCRWTKWFDVDFPTPGPHGGDLETYGNIVSSGETICRRPEDIAQLQCRAESHPEVSVERVGQVVQCSPEVGLVCRNRDQRGTFKMCLNYEVRVLCCEPREGCPTYQPVTVPSTPSVTVTSAAETAAHGVRTRETSVPETSTTPVPRTSETPVPETSSTSVPKPSTIPVPETRTTPVPKPSTTPMPKPSTTPMPQTSVTPVPETSSTPVPKPGTTPVPQTSRISVPKPGTTPVPKTSTTSVPKPSTTPVPETSTTPVPKPGTTPVPKPGTTPVPAPATSRSTPGTTSCQPRCRWTKWFDVDFPTPGPHGGDLETYGNIVSSGETICRRPEDIAQLQCRAESHPEVSVERVGQVVQCSPEVGLVCRNRDQRGTFKMCLNYEVRVLCCEPREGCPTYQPVTVPSTPSVTVTSATETAAHGVRTRETSVPETSTTPVPQTRETPVPETSLTPVPKTSTISVPQTSRTSVPETSIIPVPETSETPVPKPGTTPVPQTSSTPVPKTSTISVPQTSRTSVPETRTTSVPKPSTTPVPETSSTPVPKPGTTPVPETKTTPVPKPSTTPVPKPGTTPVPQTSSTPVPKTSTISVPQTSRTSVPETSIIPVPETRTTSVPKPSTTPVPETSSTPVPKPGTTPVPETSTTSVPAPATSRSTPGTTSCQPRCRWTKWFDVDFPTPGPHGGDLETYGNIVRSGETICRRPEDIAQLQCRAESHPEVSVERVGQVVQCSPEVGLVCRNRDQRGTFRMCLNYEVRVLCCEPREGCPPTSATPHVTSSVKSLPSSEPTSRVPAATALSASASPAPTCYCSASGKLYPAGSIIYQEADLAGHCYYAVCSLDCHVVRQTGRSCPTSAVPPTPTPTASTPGSSPSAPVPVTTQGCPSAFPPRTRGETWAMPNCSQATCEGNNVITLQPRPCPHVQEPTCANGYPALKVADEDACCQHYQCQCVCSGWGDPHYITFDGTYYTFLDNCTYVLVQQIVPVYGHFRVLIDNYFCDAEDGLSCPQSIIVEYRQDRVVLTRKPVRGVMTNEIIFNDKVVRPGFRKDGIVVSQIGIKMYVSIPEIGVQVMFSGLIFSVEVPFSKFANNTEGQCGTCTDNQKDECRLPGGPVVASCSDMSWHWKVTNPDQPSCHGPPPVPPTGGPTAPPTPCPPSPVCQLILSDVFKPCHTTIPPRPYYEGCTFDQCYMTEPDVACSGLELYASLCAAHGLCIDWRGQANHTCPFTCPADKEYRPCGPSNPSYCYEGDSASLLALKDISPVTEGCFCPEGMTLFSRSTEVCVPAGCPRCLGPHGEPVEPGRTVAFDCQECTCEGSTRTMSCRRQPCPLPPACPQPGFVPVPAAPLAGQCCPRYTCACNASYCPALAGCPEGSLQTVTHEEGACCPSQKCGWTVCSVNGTLYQPGAVVSSSLCQTCRCEVPHGPQADAFRISCETETCSTHCPTGFEYRTQSGRCCGSCVQVACVVNASDGSAHLFYPGESWSDSGNRCVTHQCERHQDGLVLVTMKKTCPSLTCPEDQTRLSEDGCCRFCSQGPQPQNMSTCAVYHKLEVLRVQGCSSAAPVRLAYCKGNCGDTASAFSLAAGALEHKCSCCRELRASPRNVTLHCADGSRRAFSYTEVEECGCAGLQCDTLGDLGQRRAEGPQRSQDAARRRWSRGARASPAA
ncbi:mucin-5AC [Glossophaga mutica]